MTENDRAPEAVILFVTQAPEGRDKFFSRKNEEAWALLDLDDLRVRGFRKRLAVLSPAFPIALDGLGEMV